MHAQDAGAAWAGTINMIVTPLLIVSKIYVSSEETVESISTAPSTGLIVSHVGASTSVYYVK